MQTSGGRGSRQRDLPVQRWRVGKCLGCSLTGRGEEGGEMEGQAWLCMSWRGVWDYIYLV